MTDVSIPWSNVYGKNESDPATWPAFNFWTDSFHLDKPTTVGFKWSLPVISSSVHRCPKVVVYDRASWALTPFREIKRSIDVAQRTDQRSSHALIHERHSRRVDIDVKLPRRRQPDAMNIGGQQLRASNCLISMHDLPHDGGAGSCTDIVETFGVGLDGFLLVSLQSRLQHKRASIVHLVTYL